MARAMRRLLATALALALVAAACTERPRTAAPLRTPSRTPDPSTGVVPAPTAPATSSPPTVPKHRAWSIAPIEPEERALLVDRNWRPGCPVDLEDLRWLTVRYLGFDGEVKTGPLVVNSRVAEDVRWVFRQLFHARFPIKHVSLPRKYRPHAPDRYDSIRDATAAFNCRPVTDTRGVWSQHSYGWAIDINPLQNPYVRSDGSVLRRAAKPYRDRSLNEPGMIHPDDSVVRSFAAIGWEWGGDWTTLKDYMHFALTGR